MIVFEILWNTFYRFLICSTIVIESMLKVIDYIFYEIKYRLLNLYYLMYNIISNFLIVLNKAQWIDIILYPIKHN